ncbi:MAG: HAMP domain-containing histidine kinase [Roseburia sp.]|nr:HAMP domain-containing histidine kinase [Roseburia sp.]
MNKKEVRKHRRALTLSVLLYVFVVMLITGIISMVAVNILVSLDIIPITVEGHPEPKYVITFLTLSNLVVGVIVIASLNSLTLQYVNRIIDKMNRLASGDFKTRLSFGAPLGRHPTFNEVSNSFNKMAEELEGTEMLRSDFINNFSHEFKTPIVSIAGFAKLLKRGNLTEKQRLEYLDIIEEESLRLSAMATNVLNMTKVESQTILTNVTRYNLSEQLRSSVLMLESKWAKKEVEFDLNIGEYTISANEEMLKHVWVNLIDNAIKFSPKGGIVGISVRENADTFSITVLNSGSEISPEQQKRIFNKFYQADESHAAEGNGIGLALVKRVAELHSGNVSVWSENQTTAFTVELPKYLNV